MTPKQEERIRIKIARIRKELAADKKRWGGYYDDSRGLRYMPPELFIKLKDYKGGLRYLRWFNRTFPDDIGYPTFLFQWMLILFKTGNLKETEKKAFETFFANNNLFDKFLEKEHLSIKKKESSNGETPDLPETFLYSKNDPEFADLAEWLENFRISDQFHKFANELKEIERKLAAESDVETRGALIDKRQHLIGKQ